MDEHCPDKEECLIFSEAGAALWKALDRPEEWEVPSQYRIVHKPSNTAWWTGNGGFFFDGDDLTATPSCLGLFERHILWRRARKIRNRIAALRFADQQRAVADRLATTPKNIQPKGEKP